MKRYIIVLLILLFLIPNVVYATEELSQEQIIQSQQESLNINSFVKEAEKYTKDVYEDIDMGELFSSAITGSIDNQTIFKSLARAMRWRSVRKHFSSCKYISYYCYT